MPLRRPPPRKHRSDFGTITLRYRARTRVLVYEQKRGNQTTADENGVSLDGYIHALFGLAVQAKARRVLVIGCAGGTLGIMLARTGCAVTMVDVDPVAFRLARQYFGLPAKVRTHVGDGLTFMQSARRRFDAIVVDAFFGENIPAHLTGAALAAAARRCLAPRGVMLVNVCLERKSDLRADRIAEGFIEARWRVRLLDAPGGERNATVLAGAVKHLKRPFMTMPPMSGAKAIRDELASLRFRARRRSRRIKSL
ncbi:MAG: class I SAM-dependent methyltransferase [Alphaproteobacteria bacterium]|nr:class I SAM-dependent methyltransferase [Alphaproteobacteria bacterium]